MLSSRRPHLSLVAKEVAKGAKLATFTPMLPTLGLGPALDHPNVSLVIVLVGVTTSLHYRRDRIHHRRIDEDRHLRKLSLGERSRRDPIAAVRSLATCQSHAC